MTPVRPFGSIASLFFLAAVTGPALAQKPVEPYLSVAPDRSSRVYALHEPITFTIHSTGDAASVHYSLMSDGYAVLKAGDLPITGHLATLTATIDKPGSLLLEVSSGAVKTFEQVLAGAVAAPRDIAPSSPRPADFDAFWTDQIHKLQAIPIHPVVEPAASPAADVDYFKIRLDNIHNSHVYAQLAEPKTPGKHPALLILQWAGVYGLDPWWVVNNAQKGWMALDVMPHDIPFDKPAAYYDDLKNGALKNYFSDGNADRTTSYFLRMYLSCYRAAEYLTHRPDWDGKTLVVMGASQGGQQTIMLSGLFPKVSAMMVMVPSGCDVTGRSAGRAIGYPNWADQANVDPKALETGRYYDPVNFASHITCPALVSMGLIDQTSPPVGVLAAADQMKGPVELCILPRSDHQGANHSQEAYQRRAAAWLAALEKGQPAPVRAKP